MRIRNYSSRFIIPRPQLNSNARFGLTIIFLLFFTCGLGIHLQAQTMKLLAPGTGWIAYGDKLLWTNDNGEHWSDITPRPPIVPKGAKLGQPFFRDTSEGWAVASFRDPQSRRDSEANYVVLHTQNSGESWNATPLTYHPLPESMEATLAGPASLYFLDSTHGWMDVGFESMFRPGKLLATEDGGQTWNWVNSPVHSGPVFFNSLNDGWLISDWGADQLYVTHDGAKTWTEVALQPPAEVGAAKYPTFLSMPTFQNSSDGFLAVHYSGTEGTSPKLVVYATKSAGRAWRPTTTIPAPVDLPTALADSLLVFPTSSAIGELSTTSVSLTAPGKLVVHGSGHGALALSFVDGNNGWAQKMDGLYATTDGGSTWKNISPPQPPGPSQRKIVIRPPAESNNTSAISPSTLAVEAGKPQSTAHLSKHLGFDMSRVQSVSNMSVWWEYSPYYDVSLYLPGSLNRGVDPNLTASWVSQVQAQGWGLVPIWFGLQAPCANVTFPYEFSLSTATAASQGKSEADSAAAAASQLGLANSAIYKDIENYTADSACSSAVIAFISAWVSELHVLGYSAGVYANPAPAQQEIASASPAPDEVWVAKFDNRATIWGLGTLADAPWPSNQRMHQYLNYNNSSTPLGETYGGVQFACPGSCIDRDIDDAPIAGANGLKTYSTWSLNFVDYPSSPPDTQLEGANDENMGQPTNGAYTPPLLVGAYCAAPCYDSRQAVGFWWDNSNQTFNNLNSYVGGTTQPWGVNNAGLIAGDYLINSPSSYEAGFTFDTVSGTLSYITPPSSWSAPAIGPNGINDAHEISGNWGDPQIKHGFFVDDQNVWTSIDYSGAAGTEIEGINGLGEVAGYYYDRKDVTYGFVYSKADGFTSINCLSGYTTIYGINNNDQVVGNCSNGMYQLTMFIYDMAHGTFSTIMATPTNGFVDPFGINDGNVVVGRCSGSPCSVGGVGVGTEDGLRSSKPLAGPSRESHIS